ARGTRLDPPKDLECRCHYLRSYSVTWHYGNMESGVGEHGFSGWRCEVRGANEYAHASTRKGSSRTAYAAFCRQSWLSVHRTAVARTNRRRGSCRLQGNRAAISLRRACRRGEG